MGTSIEDMKTFQRRRREAEAARAQAHAQALLERVPEMASLLKARYGVRRVWLFGSLVAGNPTAESDVDLAVEGFTGPGFFQAVGELMAIAHGPVDLVCIEEASPALAERIRAEGREF